MPESCYNKVPDVVSESAQVEAPLGIRSFAFIVLIICIWAENCADVSTEEQDQYVCVWVGGGVRKRRALF